jgi:hypothetical protein
LAIEESEQQNDGIMGLGYLSFLPFAFFGRGPPKTDRKFMLRQEKERRELVGANDVRQSLQTALSYQVGNNFFLEVGQSQRREIIRPGFLLASRLGSLRFRVSERHLGKTLVNSSQIPGAILENIQQQVQQLRSGLGVLAKIDENFEQERFSQNLREEQKPHKNSNSCLVEKLDGIMLRDEFSRRS